mgnify:CR=1 FL=1|jgi:hypothetical protein
MSEHDPAVRRFWAIQFTRLLGVAFVAAGILIATGRLLPQLPYWLGYILIANGLIDVFVLPVTMARKWRSPE